MELFKQESERTCTKHLHEHVKGAIIWLIQPQHDALEHRRHCVRCISPGTWHNAPHLHPHFLSMLIEACFKAFQLISLYHRFRHLLIAQANLKELFWEFNQEPAVSPSPLVSGMFDRLMLTVQGNLHTCSVHSVRGQQGRCLPSSASGLHRLS